MSVTVIKAVLGADLGFEYVLRKYIHRDDFDKILYDFTNMLIPKRYSRLVTFVNDIENIREIMKNCREDNIDNDLKKELIKESLENVLKIIGRLEPSYIGDKSNSISVIEFLNEIKTLYDNDLLRDICKNMFNGSSKIASKNDSKIIPKSFFIRCFEDKLNETS